MTSMTVAFIALICALGGFFTGMLFGAFVVLDAETEELRAINPSLLDLPAYERGAAGQGPGRRNR